MLRHERDKLAKKLGQDTKQAPTRARKAVLLALIAVGLLVGGTLAIFLISTNDPAPVPDRVARAIAATPPAPAPPPVPAPALVPPYAAKVKYSELRTCLVCLDGPDLQLRAGWANYLARAQPERRKFSGHRKIYALSQNAACLSGLQRENTRPRPPPRLLWDPAAFREALLKLVAVATEVTRYYKMEEFKGDDFVRGKQLDVKLKRAHQDYLRPRASFAPPRGRRQGQTLGQAALLNQIRGHSGPADRPGR